MAKDLTEALRILSEGGAGQTSRVDKALPAPRESPSIPARTGASGPKIGAGGGIASPLTETAYAARTYHADKSIKSTDGLIEIIVKPIHETKFTDATGAPVDIVYKAPPP